MSLISEKSKYYIEYIYTCNICLYYTNDPDDIAYHHKNICSLNLYQKRLKNLYNLQYNSRIGHIIRMASVTDDRKRLMKLLDIIIGDKLDYDCKYLIVEKILE